MGVLNPGLGLPGGKVGDVLTLTGSLPYLAFKPIAASQQNVTLLRNIGIVYQNTTDKPILAQVTVAVDAPVLGAFGNAILFVDSVNPPLIAGGQLTLAETANVTDTELNIISTITVIIPANYFYMLTDASVGGGAIGIEAWLETTIG